MFYIKLINDYYKSNVTIFPRRRFFAVSCERLRLAQEPTTLGSRRSCAVRFEDTATLRKRRPLTAPPHSTRLSAPRLQSLISVRTYFALQQVSALLFNWIFFNKSLNIFRSYSEKLVSTSIITSFFLKYYD